MADAASAAVLHGLTERFLQQPQAVAMGYTLFTLLGLAPNHRPTHNTTAIVDHEDAWEYLEKLFPEASTDKITVDTASASNRLSVIVTPSTLHSSMAARPTHGHNDSNPKRPSNYATGTVFAKNGSFLHDLTSASVSMDDTTTHTQQPTRLPLSEAVGKVKAVTQKYVFHATWCAKSTAWISDKETVEAVMMALTTVLCLVSLTRPLGRVHWVPICAYITAGLGIALFLQCLQEVLAAVAPVVTVVTVVTPRCLCLFRYPVGILFPLCRLIMFVARTKMPTARARVAGAFGRLLRDLFARFHVAPEQEVRVLEDCESDGDANEAVRAQDDDEEMAEDAEAPWRFKEFFSIFFTIMLAIFFGFWDVIRHAFAEGGRREIPAQEELAQEELAQDKQVDINDQGIIQAEIVAEPSAAVPAPMIKRAKHNPGLAAAPKSASSKPAPTIKRVRFSSKSASSKPREVEVEDAKQVTKQADLDKNEEVSRLQHNPSLQASEWLRLYAQRELETSRLEEEALGIEQENATDMTGVPAPDFSSPAQMAASTRPDRHVHESPPPETLEHARHYPAPPQPQMLQPAEDKADDGIRPGLYMATSFHGLSEGYPAWAAEPVAPPNSDHEMSATADIYPPGPWQVATSTEDVDTAMSDADAAAFQDEGEMNAIEYPAIDMMDVQEIPAMELVEMMDVEEDAAAISDPDAVLQAEGKMMDVQYDSDAASGQDEGDVMDVEEDADAAVLHDRGEMMDVQDDAAIKHVEFNIYMDPSDMNEQGGGASIMPYPEYDTAEPMEIEATARLVTAPALVPHLLAPEQAPVTAANDYTGDGEESDISSLGDENVDPNVVAAFELAKLQRQQAALLPLPISPSPRTAPRPTTGADSHGDAEL
ncbi:hypothetical protein ACEQ8H_005445 [Pleosporales sp. CAS-2024a]